MLTLSCNRAGGSIFRVYGAETPDKGDEDNGDAIINFMVYFVDNLALILLLLIGITMVILLMIILIRDRHYWRY